VRDQKEIASFCVLRVYVRNKFRSTSAAKLFCASVASVDGHIVVHPGWLRSPAEAPPAAGHRLHTNGVDTQLQLHGEA
jgi:hypothetical protein